MREQGGAHLEKSARRGLWWKILLAGAAVAAAGCLVFCWWRTSPLKQTVRLEAGSSPCRACDFLLEGKDPDRASFATELEEIDFAIPGTYAVKVRYGRRVFPSTLEIVDTTPPTGIGGEKTIWLGERLAPEELLVSAEDVTEVTVSWKQTPDWSREGRQQVFLELRDSSGNTGVVSAVLTIQGDHEPPVISGVRDQAVVKGDSVSYRSGVTASDNRDGEVEVTVDSSQVRLDAYGTYEVVYTAEDQAGNVATATAVITVGKVSEEQVNQLADKLLGQIIREGMTLEEQCRAIYNWARKKIAYVGTGDKSSIWQGAYEGLARKRGDCYTYYATAAVLLQRLGIPNLRVDRVGGDSRHYWCLVDTGHGWYHFDCSPRRLGHYVDTCLVTDEVLEKYSREHIPGYYDFDPTLYPERGT